MENFQEKIDLLNKAKDAYYNSGEELLSDLEYDELEKEVGLENQNYIGSKSGNYTIKHSFIMGSLSKVQVKKDEWESYYKDIFSYLDKCNHNEDYMIEVTPKLDGCSFSLEFKKTDNNIEFISASTRGNGLYGTDIKHFVEPYINENSYWGELNSFCLEHLSNNDILSIRGEVIITKKDFETYCSDYINPRAFVSGILGLKFEDITEDKMDLSRLLHFVCYDYRIITNGKYKELPWQHYYVKNIGELIPEKYIINIKKSNFLSENNLKFIYDFFSDKREEFPYAIDGIVFKPWVEHRLYNIDRERPLDCVALKFKPMLNKTIIEDIEWNVKKTGEYFPTAILKPILMEDGKTITRASLHNYNYVMTESVGIGSEVIISLAGDIIPFVYEVCSRSQINSLPDDSTVSEDKKHLYKCFSEEDKIKNSLLSSALALNINLIGPATVDRLFNAVGHYDNILYFMCESIYSKILDRLGDSKSTQNIIDNLEKYRKEISIVDVIKGCCFKFCGEKASLVCAKILSGVSYDTFGLPAEAYSWALNKDSKEYQKVEELVNLVSAKKLIEDKRDDSLIPIIMTGNPAECSQYQTKGEWLKHHPQYIETTSWKEVKILFTNDINSNTSKMKKAKDKGIEIRQYDR